MFRTSKTTLGVSPKTVKLNNKLVSVLLAILLLASNGCFARKAYGANDNLESSDPVSAPKDMSYMHDVEFLKATYVLRFDPCGAEGSMEDFQISLQKDNPKTNNLPKSNLLKAGSKLSGWRVEPSALSNLDPVKIEDGQVFKDLSCEGVSLKNGLRESVDLRAYSDENNVISLVALWEGEEETQESIGNGTSSITIRESTTSSRTLYRHTWNNEVYFSTDGWAPSPFGSGGALCSVPTWSNTPIYSLTNPWASNRWHYTYEYSERVNLVNNGWVYRGVAFYGDDACGVPIYRYYHAPSSAHWWTRDSWVSGWSSEGVAFYGLKWYTINYSGNGATGGSTASQSSLQYGINYSLRNCGFTRDGYRFTHWLGSNGYSYSPGQTISNLSSAEWGTFTMYAQWFKLNYLASFNANGGSGSLMARNFPNGQPTALPECTFSRAGYRFSGWTVGRPNTGRVYKPGENVTITSDTVFYASWTPLQLNFSIATEVPLVMAADGTIATADKDVFSLQNNGASTISITGLGYKPTVSLDNASSFISEKTAPKLDNEDGSAKDDYALYLLRDDGSAMALQDYASASGTCLPLKDNLEWVVKRGNKELLGELYGEGTAESGDLSKPWTLGVLKWKLSIPTATITFESETALGETFSQEASVDEEITLPECPFKNGDRKFLGWSVASPNSEQSGSIGSSPPPGFENKTWLPGQKMAVLGNTTLLAVWEPLLTIQ